MSEPKQDPDEAQPPSARSAWERPTLTVLGNVKDLVRGGPKTGSALDSDHGMRKNPIAG